MATLSEVINGEMAPRQGTKGSNITYHTKGDNRTLAHNPQLRYGKPAYIVPPEIRGGKYEEGFECWGKAEQVVSVAYDREKLLLLVTWKKERTGARGGLPTGAKTVYSNVPPYVYDYMKTTNDAQGRVGHIVHQIIKGTVSSGSLLPYSNIQE